jgi:TonB family protein
MVMKRIPQSLFLVLFVFAVSSFAQTQRRPPASEEFRKEFTSTAGRFKVTLPGNPTKTSETLGSRLGKIKRHTFTLDIGFAAYVVSYSDFPVTLTEPSEVKEFLDHMHEGEVASSQGKLLSMTEIELGGYPGREFIVEKPNSTFRMRYYLVGQRFYQIAISTPSADIKRQASENDPAEINRSMVLLADEFFDSFKLAGKPVMGGKTTPDSAATATSAGVTHNTTLPGKPHQDRNLKGEKATAVDEKGKAVAVKKVEPGAPLKKVPPAYPAEAKAAEVSGEVEVQVTISEEGRVIEAIAISGPELLREAAVQAAKKWVFKPTKANGVPVKVQGILTFNFTLE